jgi:hypothetical protein
MGRGKLFCLLLVSLAGALINYFRYYRLYDSDISSASRNVGAENVQYRVQMVSHIKSGSSWVSMMLSRFMTTYYAEYDGKDGHGRIVDGPLDRAVHMAGCNVTEGTQFRMQLKGRQHCCVYVWNY